ncbi:MAG: hypothetical protein FWE47_01755 [Oscillospiraceae bacterium]|nr:hypothetical protein [Oscillospiraceae bacterium]
MNLLQSMKDVTQFGDIGINQVTNMGKDLSQAMYTMQMGQSIASQPKNMIEKAGKDIGTRGH